ncbi:MAG: histidine triad nucleotide-binding protein [Chloroflexi bacterium]|nr:histidine triad nucleotide-binding protein [Chloroflexota bacterium]
MPTIFSKIIARQASAEIIFQDDRVTAFKDIHPVAPVHILIVPNKEIPTVDDVTPEDEGILGHMFVVARQVARDLGIHQKGYRLIVNCKDDGGQEVYHLHMHLVGGRRLGRMVARPD